jgi:hypothetical protein
LNKTQQTGLGLFRTLHSGERLTEQAADFDLSEKIGKPNMGVFGQARLLPLHCVRQNASAARQLHPVAQTLLVLAAVSLVLTIAACSSNSAQERSASNQASNRAWTQARLIRERSSQESLATTHCTAFVHRRPGRQTRRADQTLVTHESIHQSDHESIHEPVHEQPPPDCEFKGSEPDTVDADQWTRLKLDYERHCYEQAEEADRKRLQELLASDKCQVKSN